MAVERVENLISKEALASFDQLKAKVDAGVISLEKMIAQGVEINKTFASTKTLGDFNARVVQMDANQKNLRKSADDLAGSQGRLASRTRELTKEQALLDAQTKERNKVLRMQADIENSVAGSMEHSAASAKSLEYQLSILSVKTDADRKKQFELNAELERYNTLLGKIPKVAKTSVATSAPVTTPVVDNSGIINAEAAALQKKIAVEKAEIELNAANQEVILAETIAREKALAVEQAAYLSSEKLVIAQEQDTIAAYALTDAIDRQKLAQIQLSKARAIVVPAAISTPLVDNTALLTAENKLRLANEELILAQAAAQSALNQVNAVSAGTDAEIIAAQAAQDASTIALTAAIDAQSVAQSELNAIKTASAPVLTNEQAEIALRETNATVARLEAEAIELGVAAKELEVLASGGDVKLQAELTAVKERQIAVSAELSAAIAAQTAAQNALNVADAEGVVLTKKQRQAALAARPVQSIPFTINSGDVDADIANLKKTGTVVNELNVAEAELSSTSLAMGQAQLTVAKDTQVASVALKQVAVAATVYADDLERLTGTLAENEQLLALNRIEAEKLSIQIKLLDVNSKTYAADLSILLGQESKLKLESTLLNNTIKQQNIILRDGATSLTGMNARLALLNQTYTRFTAAAQASPIGVSIQREIQTLNTAILTQETAMGRAQKNVGNYASAVTKGVGKAFGALRQLAYILPGIGIAGIFGILIGGIEDVVSALFGLNRNAEESKQVMDRLTESLERQKSSVDNLFTSIDNLNKLGKLDIEAKFRGKDKLKGDLIDLQAQSIGLRDEVIKVNDAIALLPNTEKKLDASLQDGIISQKEYATGLDQINKQRQEFYKTTFELETKQSQLYAQIRLKKVEIDEAAKKEAAKTKPTGADFNADIFKNEQEARKALFEIQKKILQDQIENNRDLASSERRSFEDRLKDAEGSYEKFIQADDLYYAEKQKNLQRFTDFSKLLIQRTQDFELDDLTAKRNEDIRKAQAEEGKAKVKNADKLAALLLSIEYNYQAQSKLIITNGNSEKAKVEHAASKILVDIAKKFEDDRLKAREEIAKRQEDHNKSIHETELKNIENGYNEEIVKLDQQYVKKMRKDADNKNKLAKDEEEYTKKLLRLQVLRDAELLKETIRYAEQTLEIHRKLANDESDLEKKKVDNAQISQAEQELAELKIKLAELVAKYQISAQDLVLKGSKRTKDQLIADLEEVKNYAERVVSIIGGFINANVERNKNLIQDQIDALDKQKEKDIAVANASAGNAQDKANRIATIEAVGQAKKEALERRQRQLDQQKARFEKAQSIASIILSTAIAIAKALPNLALAFAVGALGALELAVAISTPIPRYAKGTKNHPGGPAVVGDAGKSELVVTPDGKLTSTPAVDTVMNIPAGSVVYPDATKVTENYIGRSITTTTTLPKTVDNEKYMVEMIDEMKKTRKAIASKVENHWYPKKDGWDRIKNNKGNIQHIL